MDLIESARVLVGRTWNSFENSILLGESSTSRIFDNDLNPRCYAVSCSLHASLFGGDNEDDVYGLHKSNYRFENFPCSLTYAIIMTTHGSCDELYSDASTKHVDNPSFVRFYDY